ncbi:hypothetical protein EJB05_45659 [Eragrostis curvula]|uniref:SHSP domain-containing protein n=1 Tax=Eragrostis curvula TaxID=38414 RepID=A0A5J9TMB9_9POAL|nr:hypothetical protein EJB05_45659 [Eragrostis curvula]
MATAVASKGAPLAGLLRKLLAAPSGATPSLAYALRPASVASARRLFSSRGAPPSLYSDDEEVSSGSEDDAVDGRRRAHDFSCPMCPSSDLSDPFGKPTTRPRWWVAKKDEDAVQLKVPMPGLRKEHVKVWADRNALVIKGEVSADGDDDDDDEYELRYSRRIELPADTFKMDQVRAEMKNGLLKITVPKVKYEERKDVVHVAVE